MKNIRFSVAICVYGKDNPEWFDEAVNSVINQTIRPDEIVLVVDGPVSGELDDIIKKHEVSECFKVIRFAENKGHGDARREAMRACSCEYIALMDADDISLPDRFEQQIRAFENDTSLDIVGGNITEFVGESHNVVAIREVPSDDSEIKKYIKKRCPMNQVTVMFKKSSVEKVGGYIDWYCNEDYYLWVRMYLVGMKFANISDTLVNVRVGLDMYKRRGGWKYFISEARLQKYMLKRHVINFYTFSVNIIKRIIVQLLLPNTLRGWCFQKFARKRV